VAEAGDERRGEEPGAGGGADEGEGLERDLDRGGEGPLPRHDVEAEVLHRRVEALFDDRVQAVDLVDEEDVVRAELGEETREGALVLNDRAVGAEELDSHFFCEDLRERGLAEPREAAEKEVVEGLAAAARGFDEDVEVSLCFDWPM
jgi:hypothetical protein